VARLKARLAQGRGGPALSVIVDESAYRERLAGQAGSAQRLEARRLAWNAVLGPRRRDRAGRRSRRRGRGRADRRLEGALMHEPGADARGRRDDPAPAASDAGADPGPRTARR
jgi:hypothetical protein